MRPQGREWFCTADSSDPAAWRDRSELDWRDGTNSTVAPENRVWHLHQAAEKLLKAAFVAARQVPPRTHDLVDLIGRLDPSLAPHDPVRVAGARLTSAALRSRYPGDLVEITDDQLAALTADASAVLEFARQLPKPIV